MLLFDMDGTLIDSNGVWKNVDREFLARRGIAYTHAYYEGVAHTILPLAAKFTKEYCRLTESCEEIIAEWMEMARDAYAHVTVKPGVRAYLKQCRAEGRRMAVVTSSVPEHCRTALTHLDLMKYFEGVTLAHDLGLEKKDPALWRAAAEHYGVAPEDCTVFDDSLSACKGARAAKMRVVGVYDGFFAQDEAAMRGFCDVYIRSFEELLLPPRAGTPPMSGLPEALETAREAGEVLSAAVLSRKTPRGWTARPGLPGLPVPVLPPAELRFHRRSLLRLHLHRMSPGELPPLRHLLEGLPPLRLQMGRRGPAPLPVEGQRSGGDSASLCQLFRRRLGAYFREGM